ALEKLREVCDPAPLIEILEGDAAGPVRVAAADVLGSLPGEAAFEPLVRALADPDEEVRKAAAEALGQRGSPHAVEPLAAALEDRAGPSRARGEAARSLGRLKDARALAPLSAALTDPDQFVRRGAADALRVLGDAGAVPAL